MGRKVPITQTVGRIVITAVLVVIGLAVLGLRSSSPDGTGGFDFQGNFKNLLMLIVAAVVTIIIIRGSKPPSDPSG